MKMDRKVKILFLSANPWSTSRILVDEEAREIFEKLSEGPYGDRFELAKHTAIRPTDLQRLLMLYKPHIVHFSGHGSKTHKIILEGAPGRGKQVDPQGLVDVFRLYRDHVRLVLLNACFTEAQARALTEVIDYAVGITKMIGDKAGVTFAGAFYRALGFGKPVQDAFDSAQAELRLTKMPRSKGIELFIRNGASEAKRFPPEDTGYISENRDTLSVALKDLLSGEVNEEQICAVRGQPAMGKLMLAGVVRTLFERKPELITKLADWGHALGTDDPLRKPTLDEAVVKLAALLHRRLLLIVDDL